MTLADVTEAERRVLAAVSRVQGLIDEKIEKIQAWGIFAAYSDVHACYAQLALRGDGEALKRALFLQWYACAEPPFLSGLGEMDEVAERAVFQRLDELAARDELDDELRWMLPWYALIAEYYFEERAPMALARWLATRGDAHDVDLAAKGASLVDRGQMGKYWRSILKSHAV